jgi:hypothetical protein
MLRRHDKTCSRRCLFIQIARSTPNLTAGFDDDGDDDNGKEPENPAISRLRRGMAGADGGKASSSSVSSGSDAVQNPTTVAVPRFDDDESLAHFFDSNWKQWLTAAESRRRGSSTTKNGHVSFPRPTLHDFDLVEMMARDRSVPKTSSTRGVKRVRFYL